MLANGQNLKVKDNHRLSQAAKQKREGNRVEIRGVTAPVLGLRYRDRKWEKA